MKNMAQIRMMVMLQIFPFLKMMNTSVTFMEIMQDLKLITHLFIVQSLKKFTGILQKTDA